MKSPTRVILFVALVIVALASTAHAGSLSVAPVRVALSDTDKVQTVTIRNNGTTGARVQLRVFAWRQVGDDDVLEDTRDVLVNPVAFELAPGTEQVARFGLRVGQGAVEKSYRIVVDEIPGDRASRPGEVRTLLRIVLPIFVAPTDPVSNLRWSPYGNAGVTLHNRGNAHVQVRRLSVTDASGRSIAAQDISTYLLAGTTRTVPLASAGFPATGKPPTVRVLTDAAANPVVVDREEDAVPAPRP